MTVAESVEWIFSPFVDALYHVIAAANTNSLYGCFVCGFFAVGIIAGAWRLVLNLAKYRGE